MNLQVHEHRGQDAALLHAVSQRHATWHACLHPPHHPTPSGQRPVSHKKYSFADPWHFGMDPDPCLWLTDPDLDTAIFVTGLLSFFAYYLFKASFFKHKKSYRSKKNSRNQVFSYYFFLMIEGAGAGSVPLANGSGSWRHENIRIRIRNTDKKYS